VLARFQGEKAGIDFLYIVLFTSSTLSGQPPAAEIPFRKSGEKRATIQVSKAAEPEQSFSGTTASRWFELLIRGGL
jgi:hypothetical protein